MGYKQRSHETEMSEQKGKSRTIRDVLDPARAEALHVTLNRSGRPPQTHDPLPPFWHHIYFWDAQAPDRLGRDGHPAVGNGLIPDLGLPIRMWAGGRLRFDAPVRIGIEAEKHSTVVDVQRKEGRTGRLAFVTLRHEICQNGRVCVTEHQDIVYREPLAGDRPARKTAPTGEDAATSARFDSTVLFRYSALTFNGHRIHYDADYARQVEGYAGLVVHGPLLAQLLLQLAEERLGHLSNFSFRATAPLIAGEMAEFCWTDGALWVRGPEGRLCMEATAN